MVDNFTLWFVHHKGAEPEKVQDGIGEPVEAVDEAEIILGEDGVEGESFCEIIFNGNTEPHTTVYLMEGETLGIWNDPIAPWPVLYPPDKADEYGTIMLDDRPEGFHKRDDDANKMILDGDDDDTWEDENDDVDDSENSTDDGSDQESESSDDSDDGEDDDSESDSDDESSDGSEGNGNENEEDSDDESEEGDSEDERESESEREMPRLKIFAKMKGPKGWRKRADAEDLLDRNVFGFKVGVLDEDETLTAAKREQNVRVSVEFIETENDKESGLLRLKLPEGMTTDDFRAIRSGWFVLPIPYGDQE